MLIAKTVSDSTSYSDICKDVEKTIKEDIFLGIEIARKYPCPDIFGAVLEAANNTGSGIYEAIDTCCGVQIDKSIVIEKFFPKQIYLSEILNIFLSSGDNIFIEFCNNVLMGKISVLEPAEDIDTDTYIETSLSESTEPAAAGLNVNIVETWLLHLHEVSYPTFDKIFRAILNEFVNGNEKIIYYGAHDLDDYMDFTRRNLYNSPFSEIILNALFENLDERNEGAAAGILMTLPENILKLNRDMVAKTLKKILANKTDVEGKYIEGTVNKNDKQKIQTYLEDWI